MTAAETSDKRMETLPLLLFKWLLYAVATCLYLHNLATTHAMVTAAVALGMGIALSHVAHSRRLRLPIGLLLGTGFVAAGFFLGQWLFDANIGLSVKSTLILSDSVFFGLLALGGVFSLRVWALRVRTMSVLEVAFVVGAVAYTFSRHRNMALNRPRFLTDWAWSNGLDPHYLLQLVGIVVLLMALFMLLRTQRLSKLLISLLFLLFLGGLLAYFTSNLRIEPRIDTGLGLTNQEQERGQGEGDDGKGGGRGGQGSGKGEGSGRNDPPLPVALAIFHDDFKPRSDLYYFRQQVLSRYDGHHLVAATEDHIDDDVITEFAYTKPIEAAPTQEPKFHLRVPTSMFLLVDHPQPLGLTNSVEIKPLDNPNPRRFVAAYGVASLTLSMEFKRLIGRRSVPAGWSSEQREHYLALPDDPRYEALADILARDVDPRFLNDDVMRALQIKRFLEREGFYTRKERHEDAEDPTAHFLFGSLRGYCVHFAHAAVYLFRSQGIAARVAIGYAVDARMRGSGSAVLILSDRAHAWPEVHIDGVGWIPFDIYPEQSDEPPPQLIDPDLENLLGELARKDKTGGRAPDPDAEPLQIPWGALFLGLLLLLCAVWVLVYLIKFTRLVIAHVGAGASAQRRVFTVTLDRFADMGLVRRFGETRERYALRLKPIAPSFAELTQRHLRFALGGPRHPDAAKMRDLRRTVQLEIKSNVPIWRRALGWLNPIGWWFTR